MTLIVHCLRQREDDKRCQGCHHAQPHKNDWFACTVPCPCSKPVTMRSVVGTCAPVGIVCVEAEQELT